MEFKIGNVQFSNNRTVVIAEAGVNHLGQMDYAEKLIAAAARAGADIIKFQTYKADKLTTKNAPRFWNWEGEEKADGSQHDPYSSLDHFGEAQYWQMKTICNDYNIEFMSTPFDNDSVDLLVSVGVKGFKVASCELTNFPLLKYIASKNLPILWKLFRFCIFTVHQKNKFDQITLHGLKERQKERKREKERGRERDNLKEQIYPE